MCPQTLNYGFSLYCLLLVQAIFPIFLNGSISYADRLLFHDSLVSMDSENLLLRNCSGKVDSASLCQGFNMLDAGFFSAAKMVEIERGAKDFNIPIIESNRRLVASQDGGLQNPSPLIFNSAWTQHHVEDDIKRFKYPSPSGVERPKHDEDIAFMTVLELGQLIKSKQITSMELVHIFLKRLKRYGPVLESVITITEELAYKQAEEADKLIADGFYLGPLHGIPYGLKDIIAVPHYRTTWGCKLYKDRVLDIEAWVYKKYLIEL